MRSRQRDMARDGQSCLHKGRACAFTPNSNPPCLRLPKVQFTLGLFFLPVISPFRAFPWELQGDRTKLFFPAGNEQPWKCHKKFALERFPVWGCDLAAPPDVSNAVTFLVAFAVLGENFSAFLSKCFSHTAPSIIFFSPPSSACYTHTQKRKASGEKFIFSRSPEDLVMQLPDEVPLRREHQPSNPILPTIHGLIQMMLHGMNFPEVQQVPNDSWKGLGWMW